MAFSLKGLIWFMCFISFKNNIYKKYVPCIVVTDGVYLVADMLMEYGEGDVLASARWFGCIVGQAPDGAPLG